MSALFILIGISIVVAGCFLTAFLWSVKNGQYEDDYTPSVRILFDDKQKTNTEISNPTLTQTK
ncbi:MAG: cbb3-type cytochrome oxidase assembly protein CcoS [Chitinophagales bacterium]|nr:cbb3-type cytochrome oxidase assembly protein CcoS [Chitinophagales bacterium]